MLLRTHNNLLRGISLLCSALLIPGEVPLFAQQSTPPPAAAATPAAETSPPIPPDQLDSLVAPIALYPDPLLAQVLAASTYPLELVQLQQWLMKHKDMKEKEMADAVKKENWDPSIQGMAGLPEVVKQLSENVKWTSELGNAFLAQQSDVMDAVQRMRTKAKDAGKLQSSEQMKVETRVVESKSVLVIEQANPQVVYVPSYDPVVVWGAAPVYAYPPVAYPVGYAAAGMALSFGVGVAMGAMWGGGWGYNAGWGGNNNININNSNNFVNNSNRNTNRNGGGNRVGGGNNSWQHNPQHRGGTPYGDRSTANKFGGTARDSPGNRQASNRQNAGQGGRGAGDRGSGGASNFRSDRGASGGAGAGANRGGGGGDRVGNRQASGSSGSRGSGAFGSGGGGGMSGASARSSSSRGASSFGGGGSRGGGRRR